MKTVLLLVIMLAMLSLPTFAQSGNISPDLKEKNINDRVRSNQQMNDRLNAKQGRKAIDGCLKKQSQGQAETRKAMSNMNKIKAPKVNSGQF